MADKPVLNQYDRSLEGFELEELVQRIASVLDKHGALTVADYRRELHEARNDSRRRLGEVTLDLPKASPALNSGTVPVKSGSTPVNSGTIPAQDLAPNGLNAPLHQVADADSFAPVGELGVARYRHTFTGDRHLDALLVNKGTEVLIVTFHGALDRKRYTLPRFERLATTGEFGQSMMFFSDPTLWTDPTFQLAWYTGWKDQEVQPLIADWAVRAAHAVGASRIIFTGSSGGGFAALQVSALVPGSVCLAFNPSTSIHGYLSDGTSTGTQRTYVKVLYPELAGGNVWAMDFTDDWAAGLGDRMSVRKRYATPRENYVIYADNPNDWHHDIDLPALKEVMTATGSAERLRVHSYEGPKSHVPPNPRQFKEAMAKALAWCRELPPVS